MSIIYAYNAYCYYHIEQQYEPIISSLNAARTISESNCSNGIKLTATFAVLNNGSCYLIMCVINVGDRVVNYTFTINLYQLSGNYCELGQKLVYFSIYNNSECFDLFPIIPGGPAMFFQNTTIHIYPGERLVYYYEIKGYYQSSLFQCKFVQFPPGNYTIKVYDVFNQQVTLHVQLR